ncbi:MAG: hypothetical protein ACK559_16750, partial [bacterium]
GDDARVVGLQDRIVDDVLQHGLGGVDPLVVDEVRLAEDAREVEAEAVDVQLLDHEVQAVEDQAPRGGVVGAGLVADAGVVPVGLPVGGQRVPGGVVEAAEAVQAGHLLRVEVDLVGVLVGLEVQPLPPQPAFARVVVD